MDIKDIKKLQLMNEKISIEQILIVYQLEHG
nr:MAG TPA: hypothetical protein [Bacteriophage sp.]DAI57859.1 MAG TPA: hypothetical protein [Caudoviricetes sp.]